MKTPTTEQAQASLPLREALLPPKLRELRQKLSQKAKQQKRYRFYSLYSLLCRAEVLQAAWEAVQRNGGSSGVDRQTIAHIAATSESQARFLAELRASLVERTYRAQAVRRVWKRRDRGTPQGGVLSPLLANIYLHWFDRAFHRPDGPAQWANAKLVRYAGDFVVLARHVGQRVQRYIEDKLEHWLLLEINREKTRVLDLRQSGQSLDFLGFTFRRERDRYGRAKHFWNLEPSRKALQRERAVLREQTGPEQCWVPLPELIERLNRHLAGWGNYFRLGNPRKAFHKLNAFVQLRLAGQLRRRSQRGWRAPKDESHYAYFVRMGLKYL